MVTQQNNIMPGADVYTSDGDKLGQVVEVRGGIFKVDVSMMPDYWLPVACVRTTDGTGVRLEFSKDEVGDRKVDKPQAA